MTGWVVLAAGGWGLTQWMGEPSATGGPGPGSARPSGPGGEPGPQPESACDDGIGHSARHPAATPAPLLSASAPPVDGGTARLTQVVCVRARLGSAD
ncbi:hypothetical protein [Streptomyces sp. NBC_01363]|uniref:hypothetical protein n=1 Tax=Streptomyces sp. NBC_01363 TaxID=2903840 RepID=UPI00225C14F9|nr:hypothetical protein [Streptomyces sp. NBC_01363]MCX4729964.1 hypothetical protein [Streptomyces sp. NBC_01363]